MTALTRSPIKDPEFSQEDIELSFTVLVAMNGDFRSASKYLADRHCVFVAPADLSRWKTIFRDYYHDIAERLAPKVEEDIIREAREVAGRAMMLEARLLDETERQLDAGEIKDAPRAAAQIAKVKAAAVDKLLTLTGRPQQITATQSLSDLVRGLQARGILIDAESDAIEVFDESAPD